MKIKLQPWNQWGVSARLILLAIIPVAVLFLTGTYYNYSTRLAEVREDIAERGLVVAASMAESSEYGLTSGNLLDLEHIATSLVQADQSISEIDILNEERNLVVHVSPKIQRQHDDRVFEAPVKRRMLVIPDFQADGLPQVSGAESPVSTAASGVIGYVRVRMSPTELLAKQTDRILIQSLITLLSLFISCGFALYMASRLNRPIATAIRALRDIRGGDYRVHVDIDEGGEIGDLLLSINEMSIALDEAKNRLEEKVRERTKELESSRNEALSANADKRKLIQKVDSAVEDERKSIAVEIHDELNAALLSVRINSQSIRDLTDGPNYESSQDEIRARAQATIDTSANLYASARKIVRRLRPEVLDILGLQGAASEMMHNFEKLHPECRVTFNASGDFSRIESSLSIAAYRLLQEALSNVAKHTKATKVAASLIVDDQDDVLHLSIVDNGDGFDVNASNPGIGLIGMSERVFAFNGKLEIASERGVGTSISIEFGLARNAQQ